MVHLDLLPALNFQGIPWLEHPRRSWQICFSFWVVPFQWKWVSKIFSPLQSYRLGQCLRGVFDRLNEQKQPADWILDDMHWILLFRSDFKYPGHFGHLFDPNKWKSKNNDWRRKYFLHRGMSHKFIGPLWVPFSSGKVMCLCLHHSSQTFHNHLRHLSFILLLKI